MRNQGPSTTELMGTEVGKAFVKAREKADSLKQYYRENEIGEQEVIAWNPFKLARDTDKYGNLRNPAAEAIALAFDEMIQRVIPADAVLSTRFQNWITKEKNELMVDTRLNKDSYFKKQLDFETGEVRENYGNALIQAKLEFLGKSLSILEKSFKKHMQQSPEIAFASKEELDKWQNYYNSQNQKVQQILESGDYSYYDKKDKEGNVTALGTEQDALAHQKNLSNLMSNIDKAQAEQSARVAGVSNENTQQNTQTDYVGNALDDRQTQTLRRRQ